MNITKEQIDDLNIIVSVQIEKDDYESNVNKVLRDYRRKANMPGFRPGKVPEGLIRKMYGKGVLIEEINKFVSESMQKYIEEEQIAYIGEPLPKMSGDEIDWEIGNNFIFDFEMGLAPKFDVNLSKDDKITKYEIIIDRENIDKELEHHAKRYGQYVETDAVVDFTEKLLGDIVQLDDNNQPLQGGHAAEDSSLLLQILSSEELKKTFEGAKIGDEIIFNLSDYFPNTWEITSILQINKDEIGDISASQFKFTVKSIQKYANAELNQELFDKILGEDGVVTSLEEFEGKIKEALAQKFEQNSMVKFKNDIFDYLMKKIEMKLPEEFMMKWLKTSNNEVTEEDIAKDFPILLEKIKWELIIKTIAKEMDLKVEENEIIGYALSATSQQFAMYGMHNIPEKELSDHVANMLKDEKYVRDVMGKVLENKVVTTALNTVEVNLQEINVEEFNKL